MSADCFISAYKTSVSRAASLSWALPDYRVPRDPKTVEIQSAAPIRLRAARNDYESFQLALIPTSGDFTDVKEELLGDLVGPGGATISATEVDLFYEYYTQVVTPTDETCAPGWYPDALVPTTSGADGKGAPLTAPHNRVFTFFTTVHTPADAAPGTYKGTLRVSANGGGWQATVPFEVVVWDFALPKKNTILTAYGYGRGIPWDYHNAETEEDRRLVFDKYLALADKYRISPFESTPLDQIGIEWRPDANPPCCEPDFANFDAEIERVLSTYNFTSFRVNVFHADEIEGYGFDTPEYQAMYKDYATKLHAHLKEKGLLDFALGKSFDEPTPAQYPYISKIFALLTEYAPGLKLVLTEEPNVGFCEELDKTGARIKYWVPLSAYYSEERAAARREVGEESWIYVCTGPKAPYCTEFIDHPGVEERIRFWQMYERGIVGDLMWALAYWTSDRAFPNSFQNPYLDPMGYIAGNAGATSAKAYWGNGDGRFVYPPLTAAVPGMNDGKFVADAPNPSLRLDSVRAGIQDYELCATLARLAADRELTPTERERIAQLFDFDAITTDLTHFTTDPRVIHERREAIAEMVEVLSKRAPAKK